MEIRFADDGATTVIFAALLIWGFKARYTDQSKDIKQTHLLEAFAYRWFQSYCVAWCVDSNLKHHPLLGVCINGTLLIYDI